MSDCVVVSCVWVTVSPSHPHPLILSPSPSPLSLNSPSHPHPLPSHSTHPLTQLTLSFSHSTHPLLLSPPHPLPSHSTHPLLLSTYPINGTQNFVADLQAALDGSHMKHVTSSHLHITHSKLCVLQHTNVSRVE